MRVRTLFVALATATCCWALSAAVQPPTASAQDCGRPHGPLVAYGHSYLHSPGIGGAVASYATLAAGQLHIPVQVRAVDRGGTLEVERLVQQGTTRWVPGSADLVVIDSGINDILRGLPTAQWTAALRRTLTAFVPPSVPTILLIRPLPVRAAGHPGRDPRVIAGYAAEQRRVAAEFSAVRIVDAGPGWNPRLDLGPDGIHPNSAGMLHLAQAVDATAAQAFCAP